MKSIDICHLATAHARNDTRVGVKMAQAAAQSGYNVVFIVADGLPFSKVGQMDVYGSRHFKSRIVRMLFSPCFVAYQAVKLKAQLYKIHDPELIPIFLILSFFLKARIVFDSHEDVPIQILAKDYMPLFLRKVLSALTKILMVLAAWRFSGVITATPFIANKFIKYNKNSVPICNFPFLPEYEGAGERKRSATEANIIYVGNIGRHRGIFELLDAVDLCQNKVTLHLVGKFSNSLEEAEARKCPGWSKVKYHGWQDRNGVAEVLSVGDIGMVNLHPIPNYVDALPVKLFEYMGAGLPVIASDFPEWRRIVIGQNVGKVVDPLSPKEIARTIDEMLNAPEILRAMSMKGRSSARELYNWDSEAQKLLSFYKMLGVSPSGVPLNNRD